MIMNTNPFDTFLTQISEKVSDFVIDNAIQKKSFKKLFYEQYAQFSDGDHEFKIKTFNLMMNNYVYNIEYFYMIYQNQFNYDLIQKFSEFLLLFKHPTETKRYEKIYPWIRENISMNSMLNMIAMEFQKKSTTDNVFRRYSEINNEFADILKMMYQIHESGEELFTITPLRFREYHNKLVRVHLRATIKNVDYKQYFLSVPVKKDNLEICEPLNSYQLAEWATCVKNCVYSYQDKVIQGTSAIFLIKENGDPKFTVEVSNPTEKNKSNISQIEKIYRSSMTNEERTKITNFISEIIHDKKNIESIS